MRVSKIIPFLRPQDFEQEQYQSGTRMEQFISGYGTKTEQYISGYTPSQGVAYQFIDASQVTLEVVHASSVSKPASHYFTLSSSYNEDYKKINNTSALFSTALQALQNYKLRLKDAVVGGPIFIGASHYSLSPTTLKDVYFTMTEDLGAINVSYEYTAYNSVSSNQTAGHSISYNGFKLAGDSVSYYASIIVLKRVTTPISNLQLIEVGKTPIYSTREVDDTSKPIYSEREVPVYDYRWREISPK